MPIFGLNSDSSSSEKDPNSALEHYHLDDTTFPKRQTDYQSNDNNKRIRTQYTGLPNYKELGIDPVYTPLDKTLHRSSSDHFSQVTEANLETSPSDQPFSPRTIAKNFSSTLKKTDSTLQAVVQQIESYSNLPLSVDLQSLVTKLHTGLQDLQKEHKIKLTEIRDYVRNNQDNLDRPTNQTDRILLNSMTKFTSKYLEFSSKLIREKHKLDAALYNQAQTINDTVQELSLSITLDTTSLSSENFTASDNFLIQEEVTSPSSLHQQENPYPVKVSDGQGHYYTFPYPVKEGSDPSQPYAFLDREGVLHFSDNPFNPDYPITGDQYTLLSRSDDSTAQFLLPTHKEATQYLNQQQKDITDDLQLNRRVSSETVITNHWLFTDNMTRIEYNKDNTTPTAHITKKQKTKQERFESFIDLINKNDIDIRDIKSKVSSHKKNLANKIKKEGMEINNLNDPIIKEAMEVERIQKTLSDLFPGPKPPKGTIDLFTVNSDPGQGEEKRDKLDKILNVKISTNIESGIGLKAFLETLKIKIEQYDANTNSPEQHRNKRDFGKPEEIEKITKTDISNNFGLHPYLKKIQMKLLSQLENRTPGKTNSKSKNSQDFTTLWNDLANNNHQLINELEPDEKLKLEQCMNNIIRKKRAAEQVIVDIPVNATPQTPRGRPPKHGSILFQLPYQN